MQPTNYSTDILYSYNHRKKIIIGLSIIFGIIIVSLSITSFYNFFIQSETLLKIFSHVINAIKNVTLYGAFYSALVGGLFFVFMPIEILFAKFISVNNPFIIMAIFIFGFLISYTINYFIGSKLSTFTRKIITEKKFYKIKGKLNKWGGLAVYFFNALPFPSQPLAAILGVFKYNKTRFYVLFLAGQFTKFMFIIMTTLYFKQG